MTPEFNLPWAIFALIVLAFVVSGFASLRRRNPRTPTLVVKVTGRPVTPELQQLLGPYGHGRVTGVVALNDGLQVTYDNGCRVTFVPTQSAGCVKDAHGEPSANISDAPAV